MIPQDQASGPTWQLSNQLQAFQGYAFGLRHPSLAFVLQGREISRHTQDALLELISQASPSMAVLGPKLTDTEPDWPQSVSWLLTLWQLIQQSQGLTVFEVGRILTHRAGHAECLVPVSQGTHHGIAQLMNATVSWLSNVDRQDGEGSRLEAQSRLSQIVQELSTLASRGSNVPRFAKAAYELNIPMMQLPGGVFQFGYGSRARRLDSSFTDMTPAVATKLARNKAWASVLLAQAGFPVPQHLVAENEEAAVKSAHQLGYPVVVKPADLDGGIGVASGLESDEEVRLAFAEARKHSELILVEKHVQGKDYRLTVFQNELIWAVERIPAGVLGDGVSTIAQLVDQANNDPRRGTVAHSPLKHIQLDSEAIHLLDRQGFSTSSIPASGHFVQLHRAANVAAGGQPLAVFDKVHPDNAKLAVRAAQLLGLDLAGIDLLIDDISRSWRDSQSVGICEINSQPNLGQVTASHLYAAILKRLVVADGRVPIILVVGDGDAAVWVRELTEVLFRGGLRVGVGSAGVALLAGDQISKHPVTSYEAGKLLALQKSVDAIVLGVSEDSVLKTGLPFERYDTLLLTSSEPVASQQLSHLTRTDALLEWLVRLLPACDGTVIAPQSIGLQISGIEKLTSAQWLTPVGSNVEILKVAIEATVDRYRRAKPSS